MGLGWWPTTMGATRFIGIGGYRLLGNKGRLNID